MLLPVWSFDAPFIISLNPRIGTEIEEELEEPESHLIGKTEKWSFVIIFFIIPDLIIHVVRFLSPSLVYFPFQLLPKDVVFVL